MELAIVAAIAGAGLLVVLVALVRDEPVEPAGPSRPDWDPLPTPSDLARTDFGLRVPGYDPATVEVAFDALADAYADLLAEADPLTIARARRRATARLVRSGRAPDAGAPRGAGPAGARAGERDREQGTEDAAGAEAAEGRSAAADGGALEDGGALRTPSDPTADALRAEAALDALRRDGS